MKNAFTYFQEKFNQIEDRNIIFKQAKDEWNLEDMWIDDGINIERTIGFLKELVVKYNELQLKPFWKLRNTLDKNNLMSKYPSENHNDIILEIKRRNVGEIIDDIRKIRSDCESANNAISFYKKKTQ